jgi:hypothetical protein
MARRPTTVLPGWAPLAEPPHRGRLRAGTAARWLWPATALAAFAAVLAYVIGTDPGPGIGNRSLVTLALAVVVLVVLTVRRSSGPLAVLRTLAEYATVALLAALLVTAVAPPPLDQAPARTGRQARTEQAATLPPVIRQVVGVGGWLAELWRRAEQEADKRSQPPPTTRAEQPRAAPPPDRTGGIRA